MTRRFAFLAVLLIVALAVPAIAQAQKPNFSGKWVQDMDKSDPAPAGRGGGGGGGRGPAGPQTFTYTQTAADLTIERETANGVTKTVYKLDGSESSNPMGRGGEVKSKTNWDGNKLVTKYSQTMGENTVEVTETRSLDADGSLVVVTARGENSRKVVFKKG